MQVIIKILLFKSPFTICYITENIIKLPQEKVQSIGLSKSYSDTENEEQIIVKYNKDINKKKLKFKTTALFLQPFLNVCFSSSVYRNNVISNLINISGSKNGTVFLKLILEPPDQEIIDFAWNERILYLLWSRLEIENAFAWLSTLGGAYSALGDYFEHCAEEAGRISITQFKLSKMLGDDSLAARSKLYLALSFSQKGNLKFSRKIVREVAAFARTTNDKRLNRMCQGVWAKLKYLRLLKRKASLTNHSVKEVKMK